MKSGPILQVEDDENDILFLRVAAEEAGIRNAIHVARSGREAINYLQQYLDRSGVEDLPSVVMLDLKLTDVSGLAVLVWLRNQPRLRSLPVIVFTSSEHPKDISGSFQAGASAYCKKPVRFRELVSFALQLKDWLNEVAEELPGTHALA